MKTELENNIKFDDFCRTLTDYFLGSEFDHSIFNYSNLFIFSISFYMLNFFKVNSSSAVLYDFFCYIFRCIYFVLAFSSCNLVIVSIHMSISFSSNFRLGHEYTTKEYKITKKKRQKSLQIKSIINESRNGSGWPLTCSASDRMSGTH